ncbi:hypothetical protein MTO96_031209 [Rhipicephalus appendiculatus]
MARDVRRAKRDAAPRDFIYRRSHQPSYYEEQLVLKRTRGGEERRQLFSREARGMQRCASGRKEQTDVRRVPKMGLTGHGERAFFREYLSPRGNPLHTHKRDARKSFFLVPRFRAPEESVAVRNLKES